MLTTQWFKTTVVPGAVLVSVIMGGGYGTGREVIEYFTQYGAMGGIFGIALATVVFALVLSLTYDFARVFNVYDYRLFFKSLIGKGWLVFEGLYILLFVLVLAVISSAASNILEREFGISATAALAMLLVSISTLVLFGRNSIEKVLTFWCFGMYAVFIWYFITVWQYTDQATNGAFNFLTDTRWWQGGLLYPFYNLSVAPVLLFAARGIQSRRQSWIAGIVSAVMVMLPALLFHLTYTTSLPAVLQEPVPNYWMIANVGSKLLMIIFIVALFGTLVETGVGLIHGLIERISSAISLDDKHTVSLTFRFVIAFGAMSIALGLSRLGIIELIGQGYGAMAIGFALVYILPILTIGVYKLYFDRTKTS